MSHFQALCYAWKSIRELIVDLSRFLVTQKGEFAFSACAFSLCRRVIDWNKWNAKEADVEVCFLFFDGERCDGRYLIHPFVSLSSNQFFSRLWLLHERSASSSSSSSTLAPGVMCLFSPAVAVMLFFLPHLHKKYPRRARSRNLRYNLKTYTGAHIMG
jgi:hypothetical protein